jgi:hypothetical protein
MSRSRWIPFGVVAAIVIAIYFFGLPRGGVEKSFDLPDAGYAQASAIPAGELVDAGHCIFNGVLRVKAGQPCTFTVDSTWSIRRRVLAVKDSTPGLCAHVYPNGDHPERNVNAVLSVERKELPVDRAGATLRFVCARALGCEVTIEPP